MTQGLPLLLTDKAELKQALSNLILNASEAIQTQGTLTVRTGQQEGMLFVSVSDTGCGIHPSNRKKVFEPFFTTKSQGTGLGLAIVKKIVDNHNGALDLKSQLGQGTTVTLKFKTAEAPPRESKVEVLVS